MKAWLGLLARLIVGGVLIVAGWLKISDPASSVRAVRAYQILPESLVTPVGYTLPILEVITGVCLVLGLLTRVSGVISVLLFVALITGIASVWARGIDIDCGCFGGGGYRPDASSKYPWEIARDVGLLALSAYIAWLPRHRLALDNILFPTRTERTDLDGLQGSPEQG